jgi:hypothetical protein
MPRLAVVDAPQHGVSTGAKRAREATPEPRRATRSRVPHPVVAELPAAAKKRRHFLSKDKQAALAARHVEIVKTIGKSRKRAAALAKLAEEFKVGADYSRKLVAELRNEANLRGELDQHVLTLHVRKSLRIQRRQALRLLLGA